MNPFSLAGFVLAALVLAYGVLNASSNPWTFFNEHAILIVIGGSIASSAIAFQLDRILVLFKVFFLRVIKGRKTSYVALIRELMLLAETYRANPGDFKKLVDQAKEPFLKEALLVATEEIVDKTQLERVLRTRVNSIFHRYSEDAIKFRTVGKYPPAFGLMGTTLGMITLLQRLGEPNGQKLIGPAMSVALVATFLGLALANLVFGPISENLMDSAKEMRLRNMIIIEGVLLIMDRTNPLVLAEELNSYLLPNERLAWKTVTNGGSKGTSEKKAA